MGNSRFGLSNWYWWEVPPLIQLKRAVESLGRGSWGALGRLHSPEESWVFCNAVSTWETRASMASLSSLKRVLASALVSLSCCWMWLYVWGCSGLVVPSTLLASWDLVSGGIVSLKMQLWYHLEQFLGYLEQVLDCYDIGHKLTMEFVGRKNWFNIIS